MTAPCTSAALHGLVPRGPSTALWPARRRGGSGSATATGATLRLALAGVAGAHLLALWALLQADRVRLAVNPPAPLVADLVATPDSAPPARPAPPATPAPQSPPSPAPAALRRQTAPAPAQALAAPQPAPTPAEAHTEAPEPAAVAAVTPPAPTAPRARPAEPGPPPAPPQRKLLAGTAVQYRVEPPVEVPRLSRRAREHGTVWLRVVVDVRGLPVQVTLQQSSGHARLDEQALWAMRQARFKPHTEGGIPVEVEVAAPVEYPLE